jgi:hypothetical protein
VPIAAHVEATIGQDTNMPDEKSHRRMMTEGGSNRRAGCHRFFRSGLSRPNFRSPALTKVATCSACEQVSWLGPPCCSPPGGRSCCGASQGRQAHEARSSIRLAESYHRLARNNFQ